MDFNEKKSNSGIVSLRSSDVTLLRTVTSYVENLSEENKDTCLRLGENFYPLLLIIQLAMIEEPNNKYLNRAYKSVKRLIKRSKYCSIPSALDDVIQKTNLNEILIKLGGTSSSRMDLIDSPPEIKLARLNLYNKKTGKVIKQMSNHFEHARRIWRMQVLDKLIHNGEQGATGALLSHKYDAKWRPSRSTYKELTGEGFGLENVPWLVAMSQEFIGGPHELTRSKQTYAALVRFFYEAQDPEKPGHQILQEYSREDEMLNDLLQTTKSEDWWRKYLNRHHIKKQKKQ